MIYDYLSYNQGLNLNFYDITLMEIKFNGVIINCVSICMSYELLPFFALLQKSLK